MNIMFYIRCYPNETTMVMNCDGADGIERGLTMPNAISFTDSYINIGLATKFSTSQLSKCLIAICQFIIPGKRICYVV